MDAPTGRGTYGTPMGWLVFTNVYVALCGAALTAATYPLLGLPARVDGPVLLVFCATLVVYNLDRLVEPKPGDSRHERWVEPRRGVLWAITALAATGCVVSLLWLSPAARWSLVLPALLALGYCLPIAPFQTNDAHTQRWRRLKEVPGAKLLLIGIVWTYATAAIPAIQTGTGFTWTGVYVLLLGRLLFILAVAMPFDVPDIERDRASGVVTLPQWLGIAGTRRAALLLASGYVICAVLHPWPAGAALVVGGGVTMALLSRMNERRGVLYYAVGLDGLLLVQSALILSLTSWR